MKAEPKYLGQPKEFWANVRTISQAVGYAKRGKNGSAGEILIPSLQDIRAKFKPLSLTTAHIANEKDELTEFGKVLFSYFEHRAKSLNDSIRTLLMNKDEAKTEFENLCEKLKPK